jgi:thioredoxin 2
MAAIVACPACAKRNRVPITAAGSPACAVCKAPLSWLIDATADTIDSALDANVPVVVDLWAPWCGPCQMVAPVLERLAAERAGQLKIVKVDVDELPQVSSRYGVQGIPTLLLLDHGREIGRQVGAAPAPALHRWLDSHLGTSTDPS